MAKLSLQDTISVSSCPIKIPRLGFGVYESPVDIAVKSILTALEVGYRQIDTAQYYGNEADVGQAVQQTDIPRKDIFITTKILDPTDSVENDYQKCLESIKKLDPSPNGYVDLFLIHSAMYIKPEQRPQLWAALERLYKEGKAKAIGVSNFGIQHIEALKKTATVWPPHVNQIEVCKFDLSKLQKTLTNFSSILGVPKLKLSNIASKRALSFRRTVQSFAT